MLAYTVANRTSPVTFASEHGCHVRRLSHGEQARRSERVYTVEVPFLDPHSPDPRYLYYAVIETDPTGVVVATFPKGTQDAHAVGEKMQITIEFGQKKELTELLTQIARPPDLSEFQAITDEGARREAELNELHQLAIEALLARGCKVSIEPMFVTATRETQEEHGFDFTREQANVVRVDIFRETALSKRRPEPIEHYVYTALVTGFATTLPRVSQVVEAKNPRREGLTYFERGVFLTLTSMYTQLESAKREAAITPELKYDRCVQAELRATESRLQLMERIERHLIKRLRREGVLVGSTVGADPEASCIASECYSGSLPNSFYRSTSELRVVPQSSPSGSSARRR